MSNSKRWNYYFAKCNAVTTAGSTVTLPGGHGMVTLADDADREHVFFPTGQRSFDLLPGEVGRLEKGGLAERHGLVRDS